MAWTTLSFHDRRSGWNIESISTESIFKYCEQYDLSEQDFEKILLIEKIMVTKWREKEDLKESQPKPKPPKLKRR